MKCTRINGVIESYLRAVELEADSEAIYHKDCGVNGAATQIPRVLLLISVLKPYCSIANVVLPIVKLFYALIFAPLYFSCYAVITAIRLRPSPLIHIETESGKQLYLATSSGATLAGLPKGSVLPDYILTTHFRGVISANVLPDVQRVPVMGLLILSDIFGAWIHAVLANWSLLRVNHRRDVLWGYTAFEWYLLYKVLLRLKPNTIWISNHHDRWLILALSVPGATVTLVQHGRLFHSLPSGEQISYKRKTKIKGVTSIYALDSRSEKLFSDFVDSDEVTYYRLSVSLSMMPWRREESDLLKVLVIGGSFRLEFYLALMDAIRAGINPPVALAIRHHPLQKRRLSDLRNPLDYWELSSDEFVPEPDLVVSYGSTLDDQIISLTQARLITYAWSDQIDTQEIVRRVQSALTGLVKA